MLWSCAAVAVAQGPVDEAIRGHITAVCGAYPRLCLATRVRIVVRSTDLVVEREMDADGQGNFLMLRLPLGEYQLRATSQLVDRETAMVMLDLEGGDLAEVRLTLGAPLPRHAVAPGLTLAGFDSDPQFATLPVDSRRWEDLVELDSEANESPSSRQYADSTSDDADDPASRATSSDGDAATGLSYAGLPATQGAMSIDGLSGEQSFRSGPRGSATRGASSGSSYNQGSVRHFRVLPHNFSAQYGTVGGIAIVSRSGSSRLHGSAFVLLRESAWAATNPFSIETNYRDGVVTSEPVKPSGSLMHFGVSAGSPLLETKRMGRRGHGKNQREPLMVFGSLEAQLHDDKIVSTPALANFFSLSPEQVALLGNRGVGTAATNAALNYLDSLTGETTRHAYRVQGTARLDAAPTTRDRMTLSYTGNRFDSPAGAALGQASDAVVARGTGSLGDSVVHVDAGSARWLHMFRRG